MDQASTAPDLVTRYDKGRVVTVLFIVGAFASALLITTHVRVAGGVIGATLIVSLCLAFPIGALYLLPFAVAFGSLASTSIHGVSIGPTDAVVAGLGLSWLARNFTILRDTVAHPRSFFASVRTHAVSAIHSDWLRFAIFAALIAYLGVISVSLLVATDKISTLKEMVKWGEVIVTLGLALWLLRTSQRIQALAWCAIAAALLEALLGLVQWALPNDAAGSLRVFGTFAQPNPYAGYLNLALPLAAAIALFARDLRERWIAAGASTVLLVALLFSTSRGGLLGLVAAAVTLGWAGVRKPRFAIPALVGAVVAAVTVLVTGIIPFALQQRLLQAFRLDDLAFSGPVTSQNFSTMERFAHWVAGLRMFAAHPILGVGAGNYDAAYARYVVDLRMWPESLGHAHNYYINAAAETGALGLAAFLAIAVLVLIAAGRNVAEGYCPIRKDAYSMTGAPVAPRAIALGLFAVFVAFTVHNATDDLFVHAIELQFAVYIACVLVRQPRYADAT